MKKIVAILLLSCLSFGGFAALHYNRIKEVKATYEGDKNCKYCKHFVKDGGTCAVCKK